MAGFAASECFGDYRQYHFTHHNSLPDTSHSPMTASGRQEPTVTSNPTP